MFAWTKAFGKNIGNLMLAWNKINLNITPLNKFPNKIKVDFNVFHASMVHMIDNNVGSRDVVTKNFYW